MLKNELVLTMKCCIQPCPLLLLQDACLAFLNKRLFQYLCVELMVLKQMRSVQCTVYDEMQPKTVVGAGVDSVDVDRNDNSDGNDSVGDLNDNVGDGTKQFRNCVQCSGSEILQTLKEKLADDLANYYSQHIDDNIFPFLVKWSDMLDIAAKMKAGKPSAGMQKEVLSISFLLCNVQLLMWKKNCLTWLYSAIVVTKNVIDGDRINEKIELALGASKRATPLNILLFPEFAR